MDQATATSWMVVGTVVMAVATLVIAGAAVCQAWFSKNLTGLQGAIVSLEQKQNDERNRWDIRAALAHHKSDTNQLALRIGNLSSFSVWIEEITLQGIVDETKGPVVRQIIQRVVKPAGTIEVLVQQQAQDAIRPLNPANTGDIGVRIHITLTAVSGSRGSYHGDGGGLVEFRGWSAIKIHS